MSQPVAEVGGYKNITATGAVTANPCQLIGFYVNNTTSGTLVLRNGGSGGFPANIGSSLYATIAGTGLDVTFFFAAGH